MELFQLKELLKNCHWEYSESQTSFLAKYLKNYQFDLHWLIKEFLSAFHKKPDVKIFKQKIKDLYKIKDNYSLVNCPLCDNNRKITVYDLNQTFLPSFNKEILLKTPLAHYAIKIPCPKCSNPDIYERYLKKMNNMPDLDQKIANVYFSSYHPELFPSSHSGSYG